MAFWNAKNAEPKRNYRFRITINGWVANSVVWWARGFKPPSYEVSEATHDFVDNRFHFPGRLTWNDCSMTLVDPVSPDAVALTNDLIIGSGYTIPATSTSDYKSINRNAANNAFGGSGGPGGGAGTTAGLGGVICEILDSQGAIIEQWTLYNPFLKSVSFSDLAYDNDELRTIDMTFRYDWAEFSTMASTTNTTATADFKPS
tara:strand:+ start:155 stop:760 length:606 start_codon:yes stop_codon:yes gene_type:complete